jgi:MFS transporter, DHA2 family, multidrug resistance protein
MSYVGVPMEKNNEVSGLTALSRNIGGSLGVSFISTMIVRRAQVHQQYLAAHVYPSSPMYGIFQHAMTGALQSRGFSSAGATAASAARIYGMMEQQASTLAYIDTVHALVILTACLIPIGYLMKKPRFRPKQAAPME